MGKKAGKSLKEKPLFMPYFLEVQDKNKGAISYRNICAVYLLLINIGSTRYHLYLPIN